MNLKRVAAVVCGPGLLAVWLAAAAGIQGPEPTADAQKPVATNGVGPVLNDLVTQADQLRKRLEEGPAPRPTARNPFEFAPVAVPAPPARAAVATPAPIPSVGPTPAARVRPAVTLIGVAENQTADGLVRTAVISGLGQLFLVKVGDPVTSRWRVSAIGVDVVELVDLTDNATVRLALK